MRKEFIKSLIEIAKKDDRVVLLTADLGYSVVEPFKEQFPDRFINMGVAEQNMVGVATGLAEQGFIPFTYSIGPFSTIRPFEFIKNGPILHNLPVRIVAIGPGFEYGDLGPSHHLLEDIGMMSPYENVEIHSPLHTNDIDTMLEDSYDRPGPNYYQISKQNLAIKTLSKPNKYLIQVAQSNTKIAVFSIGSVTKEVLKAYDALKSSFYEFDAFAFTQVPYSFDDILTVLKQYDTIISVEAHYKRGGIGSLIATAIAKNNLTVAFDTLGVEQCDDGFLGHESYMFEKHKIDSISIINTIKQLSQRSTLPLKTVK